MMTAYFDDSGTHAESEIAVAACFVLDVGRWNTFEHVWKGILETSGVSEDGFHMAEFVAHQHPFDSWDKRKRNDAIESLIRVINSAALVGMITAMVKKDYDQCVPGKLREKLGSRHYTFAVQGCLAYLEEWMKGSHVLQPVEYVFDYMQKSSGEIHSLFQDILDNGVAMHFGVEPSGWAFQNRKLIVQLQAADILAWEGNNSYEIVNLPARLREGHSTAR